MAWILVRIVIFVVMTAAFLNVMAIVTAFFNMPSDIAVTVGVVLAVVSIGLFMWGTIRLLTLPKGGSKHEKS